MKKTINYIIYRLASGYEKSGDSSPIIMAYGLVCTALGGYAVALANIVLFWLHIPLNVTTAICILAPFYLIEGYVCLFTDIDKKYKTWKRQYRDETHKKLKGYLIGLFLALSLISFLCSCAIFRL